MNPRVSELIEKLELIPHPEGGYYKETYRSTDVLKKTDLPDRFTGDRVVSTMIYYLLEGNDFSAFHRIKSDESWHFYEGSTLIVSEIASDGALIEHKLGSDLTKGESFQTVIPAGSWFGAKLQDDFTYCLVGCGVAPGFDFEDFDMASRDGLLKSFPEHIETIESLTRPKE